MSQADRDKPSCPVCAERGEQWNTLRQGDNVYVHTGNHAVVHKNLSSMVAMSLDCPGPEAKSVSS